MIVGARYKRNGCTQRNVQRVQLFGVEAIVRIIGLRRSLLINPWNSPISNYLSVFNSSFIWVLIEVLEIGIRFKIFYCYRGSSAFKLWNQFYQHNLNFRFSQIPDFRFPN